MALSNWSSQLCPNPACPLFEQPGQQNIRPRGWLGRKKDIRLLWCRTCGQRFSERHGTALYRSKLSPRKFGSVVAHITEGCGVRATGRLCDVHPNTVVRTVQRAGRHAQAFHDVMVKDLDVVAIQIDEKRCALRGHRLLPAQPKGRPAKWLKGLQQADGRVRRYQRRQASWDHICLATMEKLVISARFGSRGLSPSLMADIKCRINGGEPPALVETDDWSATKCSLTDTWGDSPRAESRFIHGIVRKIRKDHRVVKCIRRLARGTPKGLKQLRKAEPGLTSRLNTSFIERYHLTDRQMLAYKQRRGNHLAVRMENYVAASWVAIAAYNFCRPHRMLRCGSDGSPHQTPAQAAGLTRRQWSLGDVLGYPLMGSAMRMNTCGEDTLTPQEPTTKRNRPMRKPDPGVSDWHVLDAGKFLAELAETMGFSSIDSLRPYLELAAARRW